ncbi:YdjC-like protein [Roseibium album]|nr:YdjC-like protein [Roseibium album]
MPCSWTTHAATLFNVHSEIDVGIHLTLTSEWNASKWRPLTQADSLINEKGNFSPLVMPRKGDDRPCLADADWSIDEITNEFSAQISLGVSMFKTFHMSARTC